MRKHMILLMMVFAASLAACSSQAPPLEIVAAAVEGTLTARTATVQVYASTATAAGWTPTPTHTPTVTPEPTATATLTQPPPPTRTATPTPDTRVIIDDPKLFLCENGSMDGFYRGVYPSTNASIVKATNTDYGYAFIEETGRVDGYTAAYYNEPSRNNSLPDWFTCSVERFVTVEGAQLALANFFYVPKYGGDWQRSDLEPILGEYGYVLLAKENKGAGSGKAEQHVRFCYRNFVIDIGADGWENEMDLDYLISVGRGVVSRLDLAYLSSPALP